MHFGLSLRIRKDLRLWSRESHALLLDCQRIKFKGVVNVPDNVIVIHPDDASMLIIRALRARL